jgi:hypothetical protein
LTELNGEQAGGRRVHLVPTSKRVITVTAGLALILTGTPAAAFASPARPAAAPSSVLQTIPLAPAARAFGATSAGTPAVLPRATGTFSLIGATWTDPGTRLTGTVEVRVRAAAGGRWSGWLTLEADGRSPADRGSVDGGGRGHTDPVWVGPSDGVEARLAGGAAAPAGLRLDLVNPDEPLPAAAARADTGGRGGAAAAVPPRPAPRMVTRAGWGANEGIVEHAPEYTPDVRVMFVHHTAGSNAYSCAESASLVRGIQRYHVLSNGWNDIGYNFLVDKCGRLFEGRRGGVDRAVLGAHTMGFNSHSSAIAVIGDYRSRGVSATVRTAIAQVAAYKLGAYGQWPGGRTALVSNGSDRYAKGTTVAFDRISGHRDAGRTACPGDTLYGQLGAIRAVAGAAPSGLAFAQMSGAVRVGGAYYTRGLMTPLWSTRTASGLLHRFDVFVDGKLVVSAPNGHRRTTLRLPAGKHTVLVRAVHLNGRTASVAATVISDATAPIFTQGPYFGLRTGSLRSSVPVLLGWTAADAGGLYSVALTSPRQVDLGITARTWSGTARANVASTWRLRATDRTRNSRTVAFVRTPALAPEGVAARSGPWQALRNPAHLGGTALLSTTPGATIGWRFVGRSASLVMSRTPSSGRVTVYLDGDRIGSLDLGAATTAHRQAVFARNWGVLGTHTVKLVVEGTPGRPGVLADGLVVLR